MSSPLITHLMQDVARDPDATQLLIRVLNHEARPSQLLTTPRATRAAARALRAKPSHIVETVKEIVTAARQDAKRTRLRRVIAPGTTAFDSEVHTLDPQLPQVHGR
jgi:menaquinone-9 beta-reductase